MRAVPDTNVLISSVISTGVPHEVVVAGFSSDSQIIISIDMLAEFRETLLKYPNKFLEAAVAGHVDYIVSGDQHLLDLGSFRGIDIVTPRTFYEHLDDR